MSSEVTPSPTAPNSETTPNSEATIIPLSKLPEVQTSDQTETEHKSSRTSSANPDSEAAKAAPDAVEQLRIAQVRIGALRAAKGLCAIRDHLNLTQREVEERSFQIAERERNPAFRITRSRLSHIEHGAGFGPPKLLSLAEIYNLSVPELFVCWSNRWWEDEFAAADDEEDADNDGEDQ